MSFTGVSGKMEEESLMLLVKVKTSGVKLPLDRGERLNACSGRGKHLALVSHSEVGIKKGNSVDLWIFPPWRDGRLPAPLSPQTESGCGCGSRRTRKVRRACGFRRLLVVTSVRRYLSRKHGAIGLRISPSAGARVNPAPLPGSKERRAHGAPVIYHTGPSQQNWTPPQHVRSQLGKTFRKTYDHDNPSNAKACITRTENFLITDLLSVK